MSHMMIDIETLGTRPGSVILSIGAVTFSPYRQGSMGPVFYRNVSRASCEELGLTVDAETEKWWASDDRTHARSQLESQPVSIKSALVDLMVFVKGNAVAKVWSHGVGFDVVLLECAYHAAGWEAPWSFRDACDTRTLYEIAAYSPSCVIHHGTHHNALDDARHQVVCVQQACKSLRRRRR